MSLPPEEYRIYIRSRKEQPIGQAPSKTYRLNIWQQLGASHALQLLGKYTPHLSLAAARGNASPDERSVFQPAEGPCIGYHLSKTNEPLAKRAKPCSERNFHYNTWWALVDNPLKEGKQLLIPLSGDDRNDAAIPEQSLQGIWAAFDALGFPDFFGRYLKRVETSEGTRWTCDARTCRRA